ncbi:DNA-binding protein HU-beta [Dolichospermum sp. UHCC 0315A]|jgi:nucleoid DNA-binding protein|uniref:HU family DNA-binding protein n=2 Tax=Dolichospermum TaxID=748770 RepID=UPI0011E85173|nr:DNA-binding protein HU-beta [Dolichospermum sp. UHCC 0315A]
MNAQLIEYIQTSTGLQKNTVESVLSAFVKYIQISLTQKFSVNLLKFGTFSVRFLDEREGRNPKTGENITISAKWKPRSHIPHPKMLQREITEMKIKGSIKTNR